MNHLLAEKVALVTGASSGIGKSIAMALAQQGARVIMPARNLAALPKLDNALSLACDLKADAQIAAMQHRIDRLDILVHCAAVFHQAAFEIAPLAALDEEYQVNLRAPYLLTQLLLPQLKQSQGQVLFINSSTAVNPRPHVTQYAAIKAGLRAFADVLRQEIGSLVRVISVYPGKVATPMQENRHSIEAKPYHPQTLIQAEDVAAAVVTALAMPRTAELTDIHIRPRTA